ncbi:MAG: agmatine deiminase family protein [Candidatus Caenarcaniphilales bacterium]|nr:agmatine deiminase family protein [Candidatus Caenarcaniphilales bacterium]
MRRLPAEWEKQKFVQITWPHQFGDWKNVLEIAEPCFTEIVKQISLCEKALVVCFDEDHLKHIQNILKNNGSQLSNINFVIAPSNDVWARDHAAITVEDTLENTLENKGQQKKLVKFRFNGWGNKYEHNLDNQIHYQIKDVELFNEYLHESSESEELVLEGGSIESDGKGTILTTESCLLNLNRNSHLNRAKVEEKLEKFLGAKKTLWLKHGHVEGDDTDSHVDTLARFCNEETIAYVSPLGADKDHVESLLKMEEELKSFRQDNGQNNEKSYKLFPLPFPEAKYYKNVRLPATYANFLIINGAVLLPVYKDKRDGEAQEILQTAFPGREIVPIDCSALIIQRGSLHCATMQYPV